MFFRNNILITSDLYFAPITKVHCSSSLFESIFNSVARCLFPKTYNQLLFISGCSISENFFAWNKLLFFVRVFFNFLLAEKSAHLNEKRNVDIYIPHRQTDTHAHTHTHTHTHKAKQTQIPADLTVLESLRSANSKQNKVTMKHTSNFGCPFIFVFMFAFTLRSLPFSCVRNFSHLSSKFCKPITFFLNTTGHSHTNRPPLSPERKTMKTKPICDLTFFLLSLFSLFVSTFSPFFSIHSKVWIRFSSWWSF